MTGIRSAAAIFLLEAVVLMSASAQWSGSWTQRHYGTGQADIWEVFAPEHVVTTVAWRQGWLPLEPLTTAQFGKASFQQYVVDTLTERAPRLAVIECPSKVWYQTTRNYTLKQNASKQKSKKIREAITPWLKTATSVVNFQLDNDRDFVWETPLTSEVLSSPQIQAVTKDDRVNVTSGNEKKQQTWWLTSGPRIASALEESKVNKTPTWKITNTLARDIMLGFSADLECKEPDRMRGLVRSLETRIRATQLAADTYMVEFAA